MSPSPPLPDDVLDNIFRRLDAPEDLASASAVCTSFHRVVRCPRFRSLHPAPVLGFLDADLYGLFCPADLPHGAAPSRKPPTSPSPSSPRPTSGRGGTAFDDLLVCDPLHRRYVQITPISGDLPGSTRRRGVRGFEPFLAPAPAEEAMEEEPSFRVICIVLLEGNLTAFVFSSVTGKWQGTTPFPVDFTRLVRHYERSCFFWSCYGNKSLVLDPREMAFSVVDLPPDGFQLQRIIVDAGGDRLGLLTFLSDGKTLLLRSKTWCDSGVGEQEWQLDKQIPLPDCCDRYTILDSAEGLLLLRGVPRVSSQSARSSPLERESHYFTLDVKTLFVERLCVLDYVVGAAHLYASFPPLLSLPGVLYELGMMMMHQSMASSDSYVGCLIATKIIVLMAICSLEDIRCFFGNYAPYLL